MKFDHFCHFILLSRSELYHKVFQRLRSEIFSHKQIKVKLPLYISVLLTKIHIVNLKVLETFDISMSKNTCLWIMSWIYIWPSQILFALRFFSASDLSRRAREYFSKTFLTWLKNIFYQNKNFTNAFFSQDLVFAKIWIFHWFLFSFLVSANFMGNIFI